MCTPTAEERGSFSAFTVCLMSSLVLLSGLTTSFGAHVRRYVEVSDAAGAAARIAGQNVIGVREGNPRVDVRAAETAATEYLRIRGINGLVRVSGATVTVTVDLRSSVGLGFLTVPGEWRTLVRRVSRTIDGGREE